MEEEPPSENTLLDGARTMLHLWWQTRDPTKLDMAQKAFMLAAMQHEIERLPPEAQSEGWAIGAQIFRERYLVTQEPHYLEWALDHGDRAINIAPPASRERAIALSTQGAIHRSVLLATGDPSAAEEAVRLTREAVNTPGLDARDRAAILNDFANALRHRFMRKGNAQDLDDSIERHREALAAVDPDDNNRPGILNNLANGLAYRFHAFEKLSDLELLIKQRQLAYEGTPPKHAAWPRHASNYARDLLLRYEWTRQPAPLREAVHTAREAVEATPADAVDKDLHYQNYFRIMAAVAASEIREEFRARLDGLELIDRADFLPGISSQGKALAQNAVGLDFLHRAKERNDLGLVDRAIKNLTSAITGVGGSDKAWAAFHLAEALAHRHFLTKSVPDAESAARAYSVAITAARNAPARVLASVASGAAEWHASQGHFREAATAYREWRRADSRMWENQPTRRYRALWSQRSATTALEAAFSLAREGSVIEAVLVLEESRGRVLSELAHADYDLVRLQQLGRDDLAVEWRAAATRVRTLEAITQLEITPTGLDALTTAAQREARDELQRAVQTIRDIPGFESFRAHIRMSTLWDIATTTPLVYIWASKLGGAAVTVGTGEPRVVWLPQLTSSALNQLVQRERVAYAIARRNAGARATWHTAMERLLDLIAAALVQPLHAAGLPERILVVPCGALAGTPLHAAKQGGEAWIVTQTLAYAPNARLASSRRAISKDDTFLGVANPPYLEWSALPLGEGEISTAARIFAKNTLLFRERASKPLVRDAIPHHSALHIAAHAIVEQTSPEETGIVLAEDERLTLSELLSLPPIEASLAVLSACETHASADASGEEAIALSSALIAAGVTTSVATFFRVPDEASRLLTARFYDELARHWDSVGDALTRAQRWIIKASDDEVRDFIEALGDNAFRPSLVADNEALAHEKRRHWYRWAGFASIGAAFLPASRVARGTTATDG